jgi:hypothetical protein
MNEIFPLGFSDATAFYLALYVFTLSIHVLFMNYVIAGTGLLAVGALVRRGSDRDDAPLAIIAEVVRDWGPAVLSAAITAGVAPLLFVQILYRESFYTANLLLFHRWMSILPILIIGFYLLYVMKSRKLKQAGAGLKIAVAFGAFACFAFTGFSWTENHVLSTRSEDWVSTFRSGDAMYRNSEVAPRAMMWLVGSIPAFSTLLGWQLRSLQRERGDAGDRLASFLSRFALAGLVLSGLMANWYWVSTNAVTREALRSPMAQPYLLVAIVGVAGQGVAWLIQMRRRTLGAWPLAIASAGVVVTTLGVAVGREAVRVSRIDMASLASSHERSASVGGVTWFLAFAVLNAILIAWCVKIANSSRCHRTDATD